MTQSSLPFKYEEETKTSKLSGLSGLPLYLEFLHTLQISSVFRRHLDVGVHESTVWKPSSIVLSLLLLNLAGGDHVEDLRILEGDAGFCSLLEKINTISMSKSERGAWQKNKDQQGSGVLPSRSTVFRFLKQDGEEGLEQRGQGQASIPEASQTVEQMRTCNQAMIGALERNRPSETVTLDVDATLIETHKSDALYSYKGYSAYQPINVWWHEQHVMLHTQFRDGNVPAGYALTPILAEAISCLPKGAGQKGIFLRADTAAYNIDFLKYCENEKIRFAVGCPISQSFRKAILEVADTDWKPLDKLREYAEVCFVPSNLSSSKKGYEFRYVATREALKEQGVLPGMPEPNKEYPFPVENMQGKKYKIHGIVSNRDIPGEDLVAWYYKRSGYSEQVHAVLKNELAGGTLPCNHFHANAIWWWIAVISHNIHSMFKRLCCDESWHSCGLKRIRFHIIKIPGRVLERGRQMYIRLTAGHPAYKLFLLIRAKISRLHPCPA